MASNEKMKVLFRGWFEIPHSYGMVNCFQIVHLFKNYKDNIEFYVEEMPFFRPEWNMKRKLVYNKEYNDIIRNFKKWNGEEVDLVYSITYPYDINMVKINNKEIPKCVFYTSEFATLDVNYFKLDKPLNDNVLLDYVKNNDNLYMTSPSVWSSLGMNKYNLPKEKNRIITHGVDESIFKMDVTNRENIRKFYNVKDDDILLMNIGAMTKNKGMLLILQSFNFLVNRLKKNYYKLLLKGTGDLYDSKKFLELYFEEMRNANVITKEEMNNLLENHIIFTDKTLSYTKINDLYNAVDLYLSPYLAEGFNLTSLEALAAGLPVAISETGSTEEYINDIYNGGGEDYILYIQSNVVDVGNGMRQNDINLEIFLKTIFLNEDKIKSMKKNREDDKCASYKIMKEYINKNYSWDKVSELLYDYFNYILSKK